jgi:hypothetical protein
MSQNPLNHTCDLENQNPQVRGDFHNSTIEFTAFQKIGGTLTKVLSLAGRHQEAGTSIWSSRTARMLNASSKRCTIVVGLQGSAGSISARPAAYSNARSSIPRSIHQSAWCSKVHLSSIRRCGRMPRCAKRPRRSATCWTHLSLAQN